MRLNLIIFYICVQWFACRSSTANLPNILFLVIDDLGYTDVGYHGAEFTTPNIDALASEGIDLQNYYVSLDCTPTRSSFMTGRYAWHVGLQNPTTLRPGTKGGLPLTQATIAEQLRKAGYNTQMVGKWHLGFANWNQTPTARGFNQWLGKYL